MYIMHNDATLAVNLIFSGLVSISSQFNFLTSGTQGYQILCHPYTATGMPENEGNTGERQ
jgi:hypothetical protein